MKSLFYPALYLSLPLLFTSCLSIIPGLTSEDLEFRQKPDGIKVQVLRNGELAAETTTPGSVTLRRGVPYVYRFSKPGYQTVTVFPPPKLSGQRMAASCATSLLSLGFGYFVDIFTGVQNEADTEELEIELKPDTAASGDPIPVRISFSNRDDMMTLQAR